jgi:hypothetical protein
MAATLEAALAAERDRLVVTYRVTNAGDGPIWVLDEMVLPDRHDRPRRTPTAIVVVESEEDPHTVRLARGLVQPESFVAFPLVPGARRLEPGATLEGRAVAPLPLEAYHPQDGTRPLFRVPERAVVEIGVIEDPDPAFETYPDAEGGELRVPTARAASRLQRLIRTAPIAIPPLAG